MALKYEAGTMGAPVVLAKGYDAVAQKIKAIAAEHNILMIENIELARALAKETEIGRAIAPKWFKAVAEMRRRCTSSGGGRRRREEKPSQVRCGLVRPGRYCSAHPIQEPIMAIEKKPQKQAKKAPQMTMKEKRAAKAAKRAAR